MPRPYLIISAVGLVPVALVYGVAPATVLPELLHVTVEGTDLTHVLRAVMGLYLAMIVLWILGAMRTSLTRTAVVSEVVFMLGLATGRLLSLLVDGAPSFFLVGSLIAELALGGWGILVLRKMAGWTAFR